MLYYDCAEESQTLRKALYQLALATISGLMLTGTSSLASPIPGGLASGSKIFSELNGGLVQNVRPPYCQGKRRDWTVQQRRFCK
jgi:hypothetical protein